MVYLLGGHQTDFSRNFTREDKGIFAMMQESFEGALLATNIRPKSIDSAHIGNFVGELFCGQGLLGGMFVSLHPDLIGIPTARHEAACASGSMAAMAAMTEIESGRSNLVCVSGLELMKNVDGKKGAEYLGAAAWIGEEGQNADFMWPYMFSEVADFYQEKYGLKFEHLAEISKNNYANAKNNDNAQSRKWQLDDSFYEALDSTNPKIEGQLRKSDCGQITDGSAVIFLASENFAKSYAKQENIPFESIPKIKGWGQRTAPLKLADKLKAAPLDDYPFPHLKGTIDDAFRRAAINNVYELDAIETHDCFTISEYVALEHLGLAQPGEAWKAIEDGVIAMSGKIPVNPSGGLIGLGHPVGATGVRMLLDAYKQVANKAGNYQVEGAKNVATLNIGGSLTAIASFVVGL